MNESKEIKVTMNCEIELGSDPLKNAEVIRRGISWGFDIVRASSETLSLQYINGTIFDREPVGLDHSPASPVVMPEAEIAPVTISIRKTSSRICAVCPRKLRSDTKPCVKCGRDACAACKNYYTKMCRPCNALREKVATGPRPTGFGASIHRRPSPTYKKSIGVKPATNAELKTAGICESCEESKATKKCLVCSRGVCFGCWDRTNESCLKCAATE